LPQLEFLPPTTVAKFHAPACAIMSRGSLPAFSLDDIEGLDASPWSPNSNRFEFDLPPTEPSDDREFFYDDELYFDSPPAPTSSSQLQSDSTNGASSPPRHQSSQEQQPPEPAYSITSGGDRTPPRSPTPNYSFTRVLISGEQTPDPFADFLDLPEQSPSPSPRHISSSAPGDIIDLTETSPVLHSHAMPATTRAGGGSSSKRRRASTDTPVSERPTKLARPGTQTPSKKSSQDAAEVIDLVDINDETEYAEFKAKQQAELIKQQQQEEATRPVKLAEFQCIICMDNPTDLTVTHCGKFHASCFV
jgi:hypothetical protein